MVRLMLVLAPVMCILSGIAVSSTLSTYMMNLDVARKDKKAKKADVNYPFKNEVRSQGSASYIGILVSHSRLTRGNYFSFIQAVSIAPLQVYCYSEAIPTQYGYCVGVSRRSATGNCELRTCPRSLRGG